MREDQGTLPLGCNRTPERRDRKIRPRVADVATVETAASEELAHNLARAVDDRRAAAATIRGAMMVRAIDELPSRKCAACKVTSVNLMMGKHLGTEIGVTNPVKICAASERDRRVVKSEEFRAGRGVLTELQQREVAILARFKDRGADGMRRRAPRAVPVTRRGGVEEEGLHV